MRFHYLGVVMQQASKTQCQLAAPLEVVKYSIEHNREELVRMLNIIMGQPSGFGLSLQGAFVAGEMDPGDAVEFAKVCQEIIASKTRWL